MRGGGIIGAIVVIWLLIGVLAAWQVSTAVNNVRNKGSELIAPVDPDAG